MRAALPPRRLFNLIARFGNSLMILFLWSEGRRDQEEISSIVLWHPVHSLSLG